MADGVKPFDTVTLSPEPTSVSVPRSSSPGESDRHGFVSPGHTQKPTHPVGVTPPVPLTVTVRPSEPPKEMDGLPRTAVTTAQPTTETGSRLAPAGTPLTVEVPM